MTIAAVLSSALQQAAALRQNSQTQGPSGFQQLGKDLQAGNLSAARADFAALVQNATGLQAGPPNSVSQAFSALGQDLKSGNLAAAQQDFSTIQQDLRQSYGQFRGHHHHHHAIDFQSSLPSSQNSAATQEFGALAQALQSGNLAAAQQAYSTLQASLQQFAAAYASASGTAAQPSGAGLSLTA